MRRLIAAFAVGLLVLNALPARAGPAYALPDTVRINIGADGMTAAVVSSTGPFAVTAPDGTPLFRDSGRLALRTNVLRLDGEIAIPRGYVPADERPTRLALLREARMAEAVSPKSLVRVPFELEQLASVSTLDTGIGPSIFRAERIVGLRIAPTDRGTLTLNGKGYRGTFEVAPYGRGFTIINTVPTDRYLVSVVGSEIPQDWHREAQSAQVIAARTYLLRHLGSHGSYDLDGDERDQAYKGVYGEADSTEKVVQRTAGLIITYGGAPIDAFYSANAGGATESSENVWITPLPYLRSVPSPADDVALRSSWGASSYEWTKEYTEPQLRRQLAKVGVNVGQIQGIDLAQTSPTGGVLLARIRGSLGTRDVVKDSTRYTFGLKSQLFTVELRPANDLELVKVDNLTRIGELVMLGADRSRVVVSARSTADADGAVVVSGFKSTQYLYQLPPRIVFEGKGYGHRVGMSQWGMQGMALQGSDYEQIIKHYYQGVSLTKIAGP